MKRIVRFIEGIFALFFDDGSLAVAIVCLLGVLAAVAHAGYVASALSMALLIGGTFALMLENVIRAARKERP